MKTITNADTLKEEVTRLAENVCSITDSGIGAYEFWGARGFDSRPGLEPEDCVAVDITHFELYDGNEPVDLSEIKSFSINVSKSKGGDPDACAESGRRRCGSCDACGTMEATFTAVLSDIKQIKNKVIAIYELN